MRIIFLPVWRCRFLEENESGLRFRGTKYGGLRNVRPPMIDSHFTVVNSSLPATLFSSFRSDSGKGSEESELFENRYRGVNKLGSMMKKLSKAANLS